MKRVKKKDKCDKLSDIVCSWRFTQKNIIMITVNMIMIIFMMMMMMMIIIIIIIIIIITCINNGTSKKNDADKCDKLSDSLQLKIHTDKYYYD